MTATVPTTTMEFINYCGANKILLGIYPPSFDAYFTASCRLPARFLGHGHISENILLRLRCKGLQTALINEQKRCNWGNLSWLELRGLEDIFPALIKPSGHGTSKPRKNTLHSLPGPLNRTVRFAGKKRSRDEALN